jgi:protein-L-isoaspartate(D-aspartate) O-methyltransferase
MVERLREQGIADPRVLEAMATVPRHLFVEGRACEPRLRGQRAADRLRADHLAALRGCPHDRMPGDRTANPARSCEGGTGCGYQAAVLASLSAEVYSIERIRELLERARANLRGPAS